MQKISRNPTYPPPYAKSVPIRGMTIEFSKDIRFEKLQKELEEIRQTHQGHKKQFIAAKRDFMGRHFGSEKQIDALVKAYLAQMPKTQTPKDKTNRKRTLYIVGGPSGTGKSTLIKKIQKDNPDVAMIDPDDLVRFHPEFNMIEALFDKEWGEMATNINVPARKKMIGILADKGYDICVEGSKTYATYIPLVLDKKDYEYDVEIRLPIVPPLMLQQRSLKRMADQKREGQPRRGVTLEEYEDEATGHIPLAFARLESFFEEHQDNPRVRVIAPRIKIDGQRDYPHVQNFDEYCALYNEATEGTQTASEHFKKLKADDKRKHLDRVRATYDMLWSVDVLGEASKFLRTMGVKSNDGKLTAYDQDISAIGKHADVPRTDADFERVYSDLVLSPVLEQQFEALKQKYQTE